MDVDSGQTIFTLRPVDEPVQCPAFSPDGRLLAVGSGSGYTHIYDYQKLAFITKIKSDEAYTKAVSFSPDGKYFVTGGSDEQIKYWDSRSFRPLPGTGQCNDAVQLTRFSPDGQRVLSASVAGTLRIWKPMLEDELLTLPLPSVVPLCGEFAPDGKSLVSGAGATAVVFHVADRKDLQRLTIERLPHFGCDR